MEHKDTEGENHLSHTFRYFDHEKGRPRKNYSGNSRKGIHRYSINKHSTKKYEKHEDSSPHK